MDTFVVVRPSCVIIILPDARPVVRLVGEALFLQRPNALPASIPHPLFPEAYFIVAPTYGQYVPRQTPANTPDRTLKLEFATLPCSLNSDLTLAAVERPDADRLVLGP